MNRVARTLAMFGALTAAGVLAVGVGVASAQTTTSGPEVVLPTTQLSPGDFAVYAVSGFEARSIIVTFCGNDGLRGAADCNMIESDSIPLRGPDVSITTRTPVAIPPAPCPCILRVSSSSNDEIAVAPITIIGHPTAELVAPTGFVQPLSLAVEVVPAEAGLMAAVRSSVGGPKAYEVTISVKNRSTSAVRAVRLSGSAGREPGEEVVSIVADDIDVLEPGQTATQTVSVELPSLVLGETIWSVTAAGSGPSITATDTTSRSAVLLWILGIILVIDLLILVVRLIGRLRRRPKADPYDNPDDDMPGDGFDPDGDAEIQLADDQLDRQPQLVG